MLSIWSGPKHFPVGMGQPLTALRKTDRRSNSAISVENVDVLLLSRRRHRSKRRAKTLTFHNTSVKTENI